MIIIFKSCLKLRLSYRNRNNQPIENKLSATNKLNLRNGDACVTEQGKKITQAIFGEGAKNEEKLALCKFC